MPKRSIFGAETQWWPRQLYLPHRAAAVFRRGGADAAEGVEVPPLNRHASQSSLPRIASPCRDFSRLDHLRKLKVFVGQHLTSTSGNP